jgi:hypothetical protein
MSEPRGSRDALRTAGSAVGRVARAWRALSHERRLAAIAAIGLFLSLFLPWYQETIVAPGLKPSTASVTAWGAFSWVEAAVLLVSAGVLTLLFNRAEGKAFHLPGGDGGVITAAGIWTALLVVWRIFDKSSSTSVHGAAASLTGVEWGIYISLAVAAFLAYAGNRIRAAHETEPPLPGEPAEPVDQPPARPRQPAPSPVAARSEQPTRARQPSRGAEPTRTQEPPRRRRPRILPVQTDEAPTLPGQADKPRTRRDDPVVPPPAAQPPRTRRRDLNFAEMREIELDDPPEAPPVRRPPPSRRAPDDDELTMRLDRHD